MGLGEQEQIIQKLFELHPEAFLDSLPWMNRGHVVFDDGLMRLRFVKGPNFDYTFTGTQFYQLFTDVIFKSLKNNCGVWIESFDISEFVPREKEPEQLARVAGRKKSEAKDKSKAWKRYPFSAEFCPEGIIVDGVTEPFDIRGVVSYGPLRSKLVQYVIDCLVLDPIPLGTMVIIDFDTDSPVQIIRREGTDRNVAMRLCAHRHLFGEADQQACLYTWLFRHRDVEIRSGDTDTLAIVGNMIEQAALAACDSKEPNVDELLVAIKKVFPNQIIWSRGAIRGGAKAKARQSIKGKVKRLAEAQAKGRRLDEKMPDLPRSTHRPIDLKKIVEIVNRQGLGMRVFCKLCHGTGSDYNKKHRLAAETNIDNVWSHAVSHKQALRAIRCPASSLIRRGHACVWEQVRGSVDVYNAKLIYHNGDNKQIEFKEYKEEESDEATYESAVKVLKNFWYGVKRKKLKFSDEEELGIRMCLWGDQYWSFPFHTLAISAPSPFIEIDDERM